MMRAVETLRQRLPGAVGTTLGYSPVQASDSEDDNDDADGGRGEFELGRSYMSDRFSNRDGRRPRRRAGSGGAAGARAGAGAGREEDDMLWPPYTPLYTNMKVLRRKRLDASMMYPRAGPCEYLYRLRCLLHKKSWCAIMTAFLPGAFPPPLAAVSRCAPSHELKLLT